MCFVSPNSSQLVLIVYLLQLMASNPLIDEMRQVVFSPAASSTHHLPSVQQSTSQPNLSHTSNTNLHPSQQAGNLSQTAPTSNIMSSYLDNWIELPKLNSFMDVFSLGCSTALVFGSLVPYIPQYLKIKQTSSSEGFSTYGK